MNRPTDRFTLGMICAAVAAVGFLSSAPARGADPAAIVDRAIKAAGGAERLAQAKAVTWKSKGKLTFNGAENPFEITTTAQGLDHLKTEFRGDFGGMTVEGATVLAGDKGWRKFGGVTTEIDADGLANEKRMLLMQLAPVLLLPLKDASVKLAAANEDKVGDAVADGILVTGPDGKEFTLYFSRETGLPVKLVARVPDFTGIEFEQVTLFSDYVEMQGLKKARKIVAQRDGENFLDQEISEFQTMESAPEGAFAEP